MCYFWRSYESQVWSGKAGEAWVGWRDYRVSIGLNVFSVQELGIDFAH
jgi:hypothetical protein